MPQRQQEEEFALKDIVRNVLEEARMVLPGIQALFGFQLVAVFNNAFSSISSFDKSIHLVALLLTISAIGCLMAPASYHRQVHIHSGTREFVNYASKLLCIGMAPLMFSISLDTYVVSNVITSNAPLAATAAIASLIYLSILWYFVPRAQKKKERERETEAHCIVA